MGMTEAGVNGEQPSVSVQGSRTGRQYSTTRSMSMLLPAFCSEAEVSATDARCEKKICIWHSPRRCRGPRTDQSARGPSGLTYYHIFLIFVVFF